MRVTIEYPDEYDKDLIEQAHKDGHNNRSAVIRKAICFYLSKKLPVVAFCDKAKDDKGITAQIQ